jgi:hypothetical protein
MNTRLLAGLTVPAALLLLGAVDTAPLAGDDTSAIKLIGSSAYLSAPATIGKGKAYRVSLEVTLRGAEGAGTVTFDPNACSLDEFGDPRECTTIAPVAHKVTLKRLEAANPKKLGRRLYALGGGEGIGGQGLVLVAPAKPGGACRLIAGQGKGKVVITLEVAPAV